MSESSQKKLSRNRPPRVQITYDVEVGNAIEKKEIPFVMGVMANLSGYGRNSAGSPLRAGDPDKLKARAFVEIDRDNITAVMARINPKVSISVVDAQDPTPPPLTDSDPKPAMVKYDLDFKSLDDFSPENLVDKLLAASSVGAKTSIQSLAEERKWLRDMLTKLDGNDKLEAAWADAQKDLPGFVGATQALLPQPAAAGSSPAPVAPPAPAPPAPPAT